MLPKLNILSLFPSFIFLIKYIKHQKSFFFFQKYLFKEINLFIRIILQVTTNEKRNQNNKCKNFKILYVCSKNELDISEENFRRWFTWDKEFKINLIGN